MLAAQFRDCLRALISCRCCIDHSTLVDTLKILVLAAFRRPSCLNIELLLCSFQNNVRVWNCLCMMRLKQSGITLWHLIELPTECHTRVETCLIASQACTIFGDLHWHKHISLHKVGPIDMTQIRISGLFKLLFFSIGCSISPPVRLGMVSELLQTILMAFLTNRIVKCLALPSQRGKVHRVVDVGWLAVGSFH